MTRERRVKTHTFSCSCSEPPETREAEKSPRSRNSCSKPVPGSFCWQGSSLVVQGPKNPAVPSTRLTRLVLASPGHRSQVLEDLRAPGLGCVSCLPLASASALRPRLHEGRVEEAPGEELQFQIMPQCNEAKDNPDIGPKPPLFQRLNQHPCHRNGVRRREFGGGLRPPSGMYK